MSVYFEVSFKFICLKNMIYDILNESPRPNSDFETNKRRLKTVIGWHVTAPNDSMEKYHMIIVATYNKFYGS